MQHHHQGIQVSQYLLILDGQDPVPRLLHLALVTCDDDDVTVTALWRQLYLGVCVFPDLKIQ